MASNLDLGAELRRHTPARGRFYALQDHRTVTHIYTLLLGGRARWPATSATKGSPQKPLAVSD